MRRTIIKATMSCFFVAVFALVAMPILAAKPGSNKKVFFVHHSTGQIYWDNGMKSALNNNGYSGKAPWWSGGTDPGDFYGLFTDYNSWSTFGSSDILIFKSCYPASAITSKTMLRQYKTWYKELFSIYKNHPNKLFVPMSTPPLPKAITNIKEAERAIKFDTWLATTYVAKYKEAYPGRNNLLPYRLHKKLMNDNGYLAGKYVVDPYDRHPNAKAGVRVGNTLVNVLNNYFAD